MSRLPRQLRPNEYELWLKNERRDFPARYAHACERSEKRGQYILTEKLTAGHYSIVCVARPKFFLPGDGDSVLEDAVVADGSADGWTEDDHVGGSSEKVQKSSGTRNHLPIYQIEVVRKAQLVYRCRRSNVSLIADLLESKRMRLALRSPFICPLIDCFKDHCNVYLVSPDCRAGTLRQHIALRAQAHGEVGGVGLCFSLEEIRFISGQVVLALEYLERMQVVHRDIRSDNVLFDYSGYVCLTDFSCARHLTDGRAFTLIGCPSGMAPEMLQFLFRIAKANIMEYENSARAPSTRLHPYSGYSNTVDHWALGLLMHEMAYGQPRFTVERNQSGLDRLMNELRDMSEKTNEMNKQQQQQQPLQTQQLLKQITDKNQALTEIIARLLNVRPTRRLGSGHGGVKDIKGHQFFSSMSFVNLHNRTITPKYVPDPEVNMFAESEVQFDDIGCDQFDQFAEEFNDF